MADEATSLQEDNGNFEEREQLLTDCTALVDECLQAKADKTEKEKRRQSGVIESQLMWFKKRSSTEALVEFLDAKAETRSTREKQKERQLHLEERRLALEEQRLQQDREKTDKLMEMYSSILGGVSSKKEDVWLP
eukprot:jgi/Phyca11/21476/fgenesh1_pg.PHYCAscaffold_96_\